MTATAGRRTGMSSRQHQGQHGEGFIFAMASSAGLVVSRPSLDIDGVDWLIGFPGQLGTVRSPKIEVQVKSWSTPEGDNRAWNFRLQLRHYNALAGSGFEIRRFLVLVIVPADVARYATCDHNAMRMSHAAYWISLADRPVQPASEREAKTVVVRVPRSNLLTPETLKALVAGEGEGARS
jgi:Domain of unknown function (DUF4365)